MFSDLTGYQKQIVFQALRWLIESNSSVGFHNADQGHPFYILGAQTGVSKMSESSYRDPEKDELFQMLKTLSDEMKENLDTGYIWWYDFSTWKSFCEFARKSYEEKDGVHQGPGLK